MTTYYFDIIWYFAYVMVFLD